jgi:beta-glucosidase
MMELGLFENPYVDSDKAQQVADDPASQAKADEAHRNQLSYFVIIKTHYR